MVPEWRGMVFIKTGGVLFLNGAGYWRDRRGLAGYWRGISIIGHITCQNLQPMQITDFIRISKIQNPISSIGNRVFMIHPYALPFD
jgi:hypothetical protein